MKFLLLIIFLFATILSYSQKRLLLDTSAIDVRSFNHKELQEFRNDSNFQYAQFQQPPPNLWVRFWRWVWSKIASIMATKTGRGTIYTILIAAAVAAIVFFILRVVGMSKSGLLSRSSNGNHPFTTHTEDINTISFEEAIGEAINTRNYRLAVRLLYLQSLKKLSDRDYIVWQIDKTNADYIKEVADRPWQALFKSITYIFERAWYGETHIGNEEFEHLNLQFQQFNQQLG